jgi:mRNA interferase RelE/StbE
MIVTISKKAAKQISKFPDVIQLQIYKNLTKLEEGNENLDIEKIKGVQNLYRLRSGSYRIIFQINKVTEEFYVIEITIKGKSYRHF